MPLRTPSKPTNEEPLYQRSSDASAGDDAFSKGIDDSFSPEEQARLKKEGDEEEAANSAKTSEELGEQEAAAGGGISSAVGSAERRAGFFKPENIAAAALPPQLMALNAAKNALSTKRRRVGAGLVGTVGTVFAFFVIFGGSNALLLFKESVLNNGNRVANTRLERHMAKSFGKMFKQMHDDANFAKKFDKDKFRKKMTKAGFNVEWDENTKTLKSLSYDYTDDRGVNQTRNYDFTKSSDVAHKEFFTKDVAGRKALYAVNKANYGVARAWRMAAARNVTDRFKISFKDVFSEKPSDKAKTDKQKFASLLRSDSVDPGTVALSAGEVDLGEDADGNPTSTLIDPESDLGTAAAEAREALLDDPTIGIDDVDSASADPNVKAVKNQVKADFDNGLDVGEIAQKSFGKAPAAVLGAVGGSLNVAGTTADACSLVGAMSYAQYIKSTAMAGQLMRLFFTLMTAADNKKAGLLAASGNAILMQSLSDRNPTSGRDFWGSGGVQYAMGNTSAKPSASNVAAYNVGRSNEGALAKIYQFITTTPVFSQATSPATCKAATNRFVTIGGTVVGAVAAVFTLGGTTALNIAGKVLITGVKVAALVYIEQMILKTAAGIAVDGLSEDGEQIGDATGSGAGVALGVINNANGLRPATVEQVAELNQMADEDHKLAMQQESVFSRYLSLENSDSLLGSMVMSRPAISSWFSFGSIMHNAASIFSPSTPMLAFNKALPGSDVAYAASVDGGCSDERIKSLGLATNPFCSTINASLPDLDVEETENILKANGDVDQEGAPVPGSEYEKYVTQCLSGKTDLLSEDIGDADTDDILNGRTNPNKFTKICAEAGPTTANGKNYPDGQYDRYAVQWTTENQINGAIQANNDEFPEDQAGSGAAPAAGPTTTGDLEANKSKFTDILKLPDGMIGPAQIGFYNQSLDSRWAQKPYPYGAGGSNTISASGCGPSSLAMVISTIGTEILDPYEMGQEIKQYHVSGGTAMDGAISVVEKYGLKQHKLGSNPTDEIKATLQNGGFVIMSANAASPFTQAGHFIVIRAISPDGKKFYVADPADDNGNGKDRSLKAWDTSSIPGWTSMGLWGVEKK